VANITGTITVDTAQILEVDGDPSVFPGTPAEFGSVAIFNDAAGISYGFWQKVGQSNTDWASLNPRCKRGIVGINEWSGSPKKATVTFSLPFSTTGYVVKINGSQDNRIWTYEEKTASGFKISSNAASLITGEVSWEASLIEETS
jgi:hypothetical protein